MTAFEVRRDDIRATQWVDASGEPSGATSSDDLAPGSARLKIDLFSLTSNNVTYAAIGAGPLGYWDFFPAADGGAEWGRTPVWGFADVIASAVEGVDVGARVYGYFPMAETLDVSPVKVSEKGFIDGAAHRQAKAVIYNQYSFTQTDPSYDAAFEPEQTLFRPLYATGWLAADCVARSEPTPSAVIISSASSKTAFTTAHQLKDKGGFRLIGLTSSKNAAFVKGTELYDEVITYDDTASLSLSGPAVFVDYLGRRDLTGEVHDAAGDCLTRSLVIGVADWEAQITAEKEGRAPVSGPKPEFFFAPQYIADLVKQEGPVVLKQMNDAMRAFYPASAKFVTPRRETGAAAIETAWKALTDGDVPPSEGYVLSF